eukprot:TRINITY_DN11222_c0_g1_i1.p1 TRINITY_DN11222_c0_g1~~TRINITY_DN11222_c0_g1_i1.p1  ORF type:complete len:128 (+),score=10.13 TRINITY_DN11222_c0_g1_i1:115-498(+)
MEATTPASSSGLVRDLKFLRFDKPEPPPEPEPEFEPTTSGRFKWYSRRFLSVLDSVGDKIADFLGLNDSKYQWVIDEYVKIKEEEEEQKRLEDQSTAASMKSLEEGSPDDNSPTQDAPASADLRGED